MKSPLITNSILTIGLVVVLLLALSLDLTLAQGGDAPLPDVVKTELQLTPEELTWLDNHPDIRLGFTDDYEPAVIRNSDNTFSGIVVDFLDKINRRLGIDIGLEVDKWPTILNKVEQNELGGVVAISPGNADARGILKTKSHLTGYPAIYGRIGTPFMGIADLSGKKIAYLQALYLAEKIVEPYRDTVEVVHTETVLEAFQLVFEGKVDYVIGQTDNNYLVSKYKLSGIGPVHVFWGKETEFVTGVRSDWPELVSILNKAIATFTMEELDNIYAKWTKIEAQQREISLTQEEKNWLAEHPEITIAHSFDWPPYSFLDSNNKPVGPSVEFFELVAQMVGLKFKVHPDGLWNRIYEAGKNKQVDVVASMTVTKPREQWFSFPRPYLSLSSYIVTRKEYTKIKHRDDLKGKKLVGAKGTWQIDEVLKNYPSVTMEYVATYSDCLMAVSSGRVDATVITLGSALYDIAQKGIYNLELAAIYEKDTDLISYGVRKDWPELASIIDKALASIPEEKKVTILNKWMPPLNTQKADVPFSKLALSEEEKNWLAEHPVIRVGADLNWAPLEFRDDSGVMKGISIDYLKHLQNLLGIDFEFVDKKTWGEMLEMARSRELDLLSSVKPTPSREHFLSFTDSYMDLPVAIFNTEERQLIVSLEGMKGRRVAVVEGYATEELLIADHPDIIVVPTNNTIEALHLLARGEVDAFVGNLLTTSYYLGQLGYSQIKVAGITTYKYNQSMGVRKDWPLLVSSLQKALATITTQERNIIKQQWVGVQFIHKYDLFLMWKILGVTVVVFGSVWIFTLKRQITERKEHERQLFASKERIQGFMDNSTEDIYRFELEHPLDLSLPEDEQIDHLYKYLYIAEANRAWAISAGYELGDDLLGLRLEDFMPRSMPESIATLKKLISMQFNASNLETPEVYGSGTIRTVSNSVVGIVEKGQLVRIWGTGHDITERKKAEEMLRSAEAKYRSVVENAFEGIVIAQDQKVVFANNRMLELTGYSAKEFELFPIEKLAHPSDRSKVMSEYKGRIAGDQVSSTYTFKLRQKDGNDRFVSVNATPIDWEGQPASLAMISDITDLINAEQKLHDHREMLAKMERRESLGQLAGSIAHELNQPLTGILSNAQAGELLLKQEGMDKDQIEEIFIDITADTKRASQTIQQLQRLFGKKEVEFHSINLNALVTDTLRILHSEFINQGVSISTDFTVTPLNINANRIQLQQLVINLITNSLQAMHQAGKANRWISINTSLDSNDQVVLCLTDNGPGVEPDQLEAIFEPMMTTKDEGTGMGLAICKSIVQAHDGRIWAESNSNGGACFYIMIPSKEATA